jgi:hypothetical protein
VDQSVAATAAALSGGCIGRALGFLPVEGSDGKPADGPHERTRREAFRIFRACIEPKAAGAFQVALSFPSSKARTLLPLMDALEVWIRDAAMISSAGGDAVVNRDARSFLEKTLSGRAVHPAAFSEWIDVVEEARREAAGNVNPQLVVHGLVQRARRTLDRWALRPAGAAP